MQLEIKPSFPVVTLTGFLHDLWDLPNPEKTKVLGAKVVGDKLHSDYAEIGSFLSNKAMVIDALRPLDADIRNELERSDRQDLKANVERAMDLKLNPNAYGKSDERVFKTHKVLSGLLDIAESKSGFNGAQAALQKLHTTAETAGDTSTAVPFTKGAPAWTSHNPTNLPVGKLPEVALPKTAPTLVGILKKSFNPVLLKNGFHWKDPGADAVIHGEFSHRLQWYAIIQAVSAGKLKLANAPVEIFKSLGYLFAGVANEGTTVYIWELLFDCFDDVQAKTLPGKPFTTSKECFNCPNHLQSYLSKSMFSGAHELPYLNILMRARLIKRTREDPAKTQIMIEAGKKAVKFGVTSPQDIGDMGQGIIYWRKYS